MVEVDAADGAQHIGNRIRNAGVSVRDIVLVDFITDAVKRCRHNAYQSQHSQVVFNAQGLVGPVEQNTHDRIGQKMNHLVAKLKGRDMF